MFKKRGGSGEVLFVDTISMKTPKTAEAKGILSALAGVKGFEKMLTKKKNAAYFATSEKSDAVSKSFANLGNVEFDSVENMNPIDLLNHKYVVIVSPEKAISFIEGKLATATAVTAK